MMKLDRFGLFDRSIWKAQGTPEWYEVSISPEKRVVMKVRAGEEPSTVFIMPTSAARLMGEKIIEAAGMAATMLEIGERASN